MKLFMIPEANQYCRIPYFSYVDTGEYMKFGEANVRLLRALISLLLLFNLLSSTIGFSHSIPVLRSFSVKSSS